MAEQVDPGLPQPGTTNSQTAQPRLHATPEQLHVIATSNDFINLYKRIRPERLHVTAPALHVTGTDYM